LPFAFARSVHLAGQTNAQAQAPAGFPPHSPSMAQGAASDVLSSAPPPLSPSLSLAPAWFNVARFRANGNYYALGI